LFIEATQDPSIVIGRLRNAKHQPTAQRKPPITVRRDSLLLKLSASYSVFTLLHTLLQWNDIRLAEILGMLWEDSRIYIKNINPTKTSCLNSSVHGIMLCTKREIAGSSSLRLPCKLSIYTAFSDPDTAKYVHTTLSRTQFQPHLQICP
jgi:hypothetical protein